MKEYLISVAIPTYKVLYLKQCINSILTQTYPKFEIVIVDDASPYDVKSVLKNFTDKRIHYYRNEIGFGGEHVVGNWNKCIEHCHGDYIICMGDDDYLLPNCLADYIALIQRNPGLEVYHVRTKIVNENGTTVDIQESRPEFEEMQSYIWHQMNGLRKQYIGDYLFDLKVLVEYGGFFDLPYAWCSDAASVIRATRNQGIASCNQFGYCYRKNQSSISTESNNYIGKITAINLYSNWLDDFLKKQVDNKFDQEMQQIILNQKSNYIQKEYEYVILTALKSSKLHLRKIIKMQRKYGIHNATIVKCLAKLLL